ANYNNSSTRIKTYETDRIDMREHVREVIDFGKQDVITKDTVLIKIDALATLRDIVAQMTLDDTFSSREQINAVLLSKVQRDAERWGVTITRVEIFNILPPADIGEAMQQQIRAERERRSAVLRADGQRESKAIESRGYAAKLVLQAEGEKSSAVLVAKGHAEAKKVIAQAEAQALALMREAVAPFNMRGVDYATAVEYLRTLAQLGSARDGGNTTVTLLPVDTVDGLAKLTGGTGGPVRFG
ncbi:qmcA, partial [Symbiodinium sp. KB8]